MKVINFIPPNNTEESFVKTIFQLKFPEKFSIRRTLICRGPAYNGCVGFAVLVYDYAVFIIFPENSSFKNITENIVLPHQTPTSLIKSKKKYFQLLLIWLSYTD